MNERSIASLIAGRQVVVQPPSATVRQAVLVMTEQGIGAVPVVEGRHLIGIFTERDVLTRVLAVGRDVDRTSLEEVMTRRPETVSVDCSIREALEVMTEGGFRHLPVMADATVVGVISIRNVAAGLWMGSSEQIERRGAAEA